MGMDLVLICLEYTNNYAGEASIKPMIYAIKLKLEFTILNQLLSMATAGLTESRHQAGAATYELHSNPSGGGNNNNKPPLSSKTGIRRTTAVKITLIELRYEREMGNLNEIYMTQQIQVVHNVILVARIYSAERESQKSDGHHGCTGTYAFSAQHAKESRTITP